MSATTSLGPARTRSPLAALRIANGLTQVAIARQIHCSVSHYSRIECGHIPLTLGLARQICMILHCPIRDLVRGQVGPRAAGEEGNLASGGYPDRAPGVARSQVPLPALAPSIVGGTRDRSLSREASPGPRRRVGK